MKLEEYIKHDAVGLAEMVKNNEVTPEELKGLAFEMLDKVNARLNVVATLVPDELANQEDWVSYDGPFAGIPFFIKDVPPLAAGLEANNGSRFLQGNKNNYDANLMKRFRKAGLNTIATGTVPEYSANFTTESELYGITRNPWNTEYSVGGSSGGSAAAVAAGIVPIAHGGDGGGSIRVPAANNGLIGLKTTRGRTPNGPDRGETDAGTAVQFGMTKSIRDTALYLDEISGPDIGAYAYAEPPKQPYSETYSTPPKKLKIAWTDQLLADEPATEEMQKVLHSTIELLEDLGHEVVKDAPEVDSEEFWMHFDNIGAPYKTVGIEDSAKKLQREPSLENLEPSTYETYQRGREVSGMDHVKALNYQNSVSRHLGEFFTKYDLLLTPTTGRRTPKIGEYYPMEKSNPEHKSQYAQFTPLFNLTGTPAISLPLEETEDGLPLGIQFSGKFGDEETLLRLGRQLEIERPWKERHHKMFDKLIN